jgi:hypothetical protein
MAPRTNASGDTEVISVYFWRPFLLIILIHCYLPQYYIRCKSGKVLCISKCSKLTKTVEDVKELKKEGVKLQKSNQDLVRLNNHITRERDELRLANNA